VWSREDTHVLSFQMDKRDRLGPQGGAQMLQMGPEKASLKTTVSFFFPYAPILIFPQVKKCAQ
jgi:hypothetical protein